MKSRQQSPIWPYLVILACLFLLSVTAPRAWDRMARQETLSHALAVRTSYQPTTDGAAKSTFQGAPEPTSYEQVDGEELAAREPINVELSSAPQAASAVPSPPEPDRVVLPSSQAIGDPVAPPETNGQSAEEDSVEAQPNEPTTPAPAAFAWPLPRTLIAQLAQLSQDNAYAPWASQAAQLIHQLCREGVADEGAPRTSSQACAVWPIQVRSSPSPTRSPSRERYARAMRWHAGSTSGSKRLAWRTLRGRPRRCRKKPTR